LDTPSGERETEAKKIVTGALSPVRLATPVLIGLVAGVFAWAILRRPLFDGDIEFVWRGARLYSQGINPYGLISLHGVELFGGGSLYYPPPTLWTLLPLIWLPSSVAGGVIVALSTATLAFVLLGETPWRMGVLASGSFVIAASLGQWAPTLSVALLVPGLAWLAVLKPSTGLAVFASRPSMRTACIIAALLTLSVALEPSWPRLYLSGIRNSVQHVSPVTAVWFGPVLLLSLLRWKRPEARLLAVLACVPHMLFFYDELLLLVAVPESRRELLLLRIANILGVLAWLAYCLLRPVPYQLVARPFVVATCYVPALILVLRRPNEGQLPAWFDSAIAAVYRQGGDTREG
jgi:hypothetical protein